MPQLHAKTEAPQAISQVAITMPSKSSSLAGKRRQAREMALQMLYQNDVGRSGASKIFREFDLEAYGADTAERPSRQKSARAFAYAQDLVEGTLGHLDEIDGLLEAQADNWRVERMPVVDRNILRLAIYELRFESDVPKVVVLDEAIELAKKFGSEQSGAFINGLLDALVREQQFPGSMK